MPREETCDRPRGKLVRQRRGGEQRRVRPRDVGNDEEIEEFCRDGSGDVETRSQPAKIAPIVKA